MIFGNIKYSDMYSSMSEEVKKVIDFIKSTDLSNFSKGIHEIEGKDFFVNIVEYNLKDEDCGFWEAHRKYLDVHFMISGSERIKMNFLENSKVKDYKEEDDFVSFECGKENSYVDLGDGDFLVCYPHDVHMTAIKIKNNDYVKKAIFKVKII